MTAMPHAVDVGPRPNPLPTCGEREGPAQRGAHRGYQVLVICCTTYGAPFIISLALVLAGCAHTQLNLNTLDVAGSIDTLYREQALTNLSRFIDDPNTIPSQVDISTGQVSTTDGLTGSGSFPIGNQVTKNGATLVAQTIVEQVRSLTLGLSGSWTQYWSIAPISDANTLRRLRAVYRYAICHNDQELRQNYDLSLIAGNGSFVIDASRLTGPRCVICLDFDKIRNISSEKTTAGTKHSPNTNDGQDTTKLLQQIVANQQGFENKTSINGRLPHRNWLYWTTDVSSSLSEQHAQSERPQPRYPDPACLSEQHAQSERPRPTYQDPACKEVLPAIVHNNDSDACPIHDLGHYGNLKLFMTEADYNRGVLADFLLFLLPQADPRLPVTHQWWVTG